MKDVEPWTVGGGNPAKMIKEQEIEWWGCALSSFRFQVSSSRLEERCGWWIDLPSAKVEAKGQGLQWTAFDSALCDAIEQSSNPNNRTILQDMGRRGHELVESKYTWSAVVKAMVDGYEWMAGREK